MGRNNSNRSGGNSNRGGGGKGKAMKYEIRADIKVNGTVNERTSSGPSWAKPKASSAMNWNSESCNERHASARRC